ncbi:ROK family protein [Tenuifilum thalassicum]|uniref:ROK family protein n=1 Tax=Tenuifilum thalassicum TaxID=2590900 RepID=A0A7D4BL74_9BACT|nr:ROK family protein [Tenuifilum thalassicum]QKG80799.1 ROK family protein [Tenuifilum thalassicum]
MDYRSDKRIVLTLDAGGTNFVFTAMRGMDRLGDPITLPSNGDDLDKCLKGIIEGFEALIDKLTEKPVAISFAFPGPADYPNGIIGDLGNLPAFRGGVALGPMLEEHFKLPVFINNDGDLFAYGESIAGFLPYVNDILAKSGSQKRFRHLLGITLGTGFGAGLVTDGDLFIGDNSAGAEIWLVRNAIDPDCFAEEGASIRAVQRVYHNYCKSKHSDQLSPKEIFEVAEGSREGDMIAARLAFQTLGVVVGDAIANAVTLTDSLVVIGGGLSNAWKYIGPALMEQLNGTISRTDGAKVDRLEIKAFDLEDDHQLGEFLAGQEKTIKVPFSDRTVQYDPLKRIGVGLSRLGTSHAVAVGAYAFALRKVGERG